jgi:glutathione S-transferase
MELYYSPFACSLASHITLREAGLDADVVAVRLATKETSSGASLFDVSHKGQVPALRLDDGSVLTENPVILQYLADHNPDAQLLPPVGAAERYRVLEWVNFVATELHKACLATIFNPDAPAGAKAWARERLLAKLAQAAADLGEREFLVGDRFTIADAGLTWALTLCGVGGIALPDELARYAERMKSRPAIRAVLRAETEAARAGWAAPPPPAS